VTRRRRAPRPAGAAIAAIADALAPQTLLAEVQRAWPDVVGPLVAKHATPTRERAGALTVSCDAAVWAQELDLMAPDLVARLNDALGASKVRALRCQAAPARGWGDTR
jgi:predicted nucleic acid-binding Zn ribbon protein